MNLGKCGICHKWIALSCNHLNCKNGDGASKDGCCEKRQMLPDPIECQLALKVYKKLASLVKNVVF